MTRVLACRVIAGIVCHMAEMTTTGNAEPWIQQDSDFGARLALIRYRMGWNIKEAARECGLPAATWRLWEIDGALPRNIITIAMTISTRTGCDYLWLVHGPARGAIKTLATGMRLDPHVVATVVAREAASDPLRPVRQTRPSMPPKLVGRSAA